MTLLESYEVEGGTITWAVGHC